MKLALASSFAIAVFLSSPATSGSSPLRERPKETAPIVRDRDTLALTRLLVARFFPSMVPDDGGAPNAQAVDGGSFFFWNAPATTRAAHFGDPTLRVDRHADYSGSNGSIAQAVDVQCSVGAAVTDFEWCGLVSLDNSATATRTNNVAWYQNAIRRAGAGPTWAGADTLTDYASDPTGGSVTHEFDLWATGGDRAGSRVILDIAGGTGNVHGLTTPTIGYGIRLGAQGYSPNGVTFKNGIYLNPAVFDTILKSDPGITWKNGLDLSQGTCKRDGFYLKGAKFIAACNGAVGVGNSSPQVALDVYGSGTSSQIRLTGTSAPDLRMRIDTGVGLLGTVNAYDTALEAGGNEQARALTSGGFRAGAGSALAVGATSGFFYLPGVPAAPTSSDVGSRDAPALIVDTASHKLCHNEGGSWYDASGALCS